MAPSCSSCSSIGKRVGGREAKYSPISACTGSSFPVGCRCRFSTRSVSGIEPPAHILRLQAQKVPGFQKRKWESGSKVFGGASVITSMPGNRAGRPHHRGAQGTRSIQNHVRVMHHARIVEVQLHPAHILRLIQAARDDEIAKDIGSGWRASETAAACAK